MATPPEPSENELIANRLRKAEEARKLVGASTSWPDADAFRPSISIGEYRRKYDAMDGAALEALPAAGNTHRLAGRAMLFRTFGGGAFAPLRDGSGEVQLFFSKKDLADPKAFDVFELLDNGDYLGAEGVPMRTKKGELSLKVRSFAPIAKTSRPLPEKFHGLSDKETRYRQRYVDLIANPNVAEVFRKRARIVREIRSFLEAKGLLEVETPMMHTLAGGAAARPFTTHHNALDMPLFMRIAPELHLKRLVVGGLDGVYEINRNFRNEGLSLQHNPEFTMLEWYVAYKTYRDLMDWTEDLISGLCTSLTGKPELAYHYDPTWHPNNSHAAHALVEQATKRQIESLPHAAAVIADRVTALNALRTFATEHSLPANGDDPAGFADAIVKAVAAKNDAEKDKRKHIGTAELTAKLVHLAFDELVAKKAHPLNFAKPWRRTTIHDAVAQTTGVARASLSTWDGAVAAYQAKLHGEEHAAKLAAITKTHPAKDAVGAGHVVYAMFETLVEPTLIQPTFVHDFPIAVSPLARRNDRDPAIADRFELFIAGREIANAFSELNDPVDQKTRFQAQVDAKKAGDDEAMPFDTDYVRALEYGLPPCAGEGIGIDRLVMLLTDQASIRDVILFPLMRPEAT